MHFVELVSHAASFIAAEVALPLPRTHQLPLATLGDAEALRR
jgi:hypothetical protein